VSFLHELRRVTREGRNYLGLTKLIKGFRSAHAALRLTLHRADLATYGKIVVAACLSGVVAGASAVMDTFDGVLEVWR